MRMVKTTAEAMGTELSPEALKLFAHDLFLLPDDVITQALARCRQEIRGRNGFPPTLTIADVLERTGLVNTVDIVDAAPMAAWDQVVEYARLFVIIDPEGQWVERPVSRLVKRVEMVADPMYRRKGEGLVQIGKVSRCRCMSMHISRTEKPPQLEQRLRDTVRRIGGWEVIKRMDPVDDLPFVQRRFFEAYEALDACEELTQGLLGNRMQERIKQLSEKTKMPR